MSLPTPAHRAKVLERHNAAVRQAPALEQRLATLHSALAPVRARINTCPELYQELLEHIERAQNKYYANELVKIQTERELARIDRALVFRDAPKTNKVDVLVSMMEWGV